MEKGKDVQSALNEKLTNEKTIEALNNVLDRITELHSTGVMDSFIQTAQSITFMKDSLTDAMVNKNAVVLSDLMEIASEAASPEVLETVRELKKIHKAGKLKNLFEITDTVSFMFNSTTEKMIERNATMLGELHRIADATADPLVAESIRELKDLQKSGNIKSLAEASYMFAFLYNTVTDSMIQRMAGFIATFIEEVSTPMVQDVLKSMTRSLSKTMQEFKESPPEPGIRNVLKTLRDPEVQKGLLFMSAFAKNMYNSMAKTHFDSPVRD